MVQSSFVEVAKLFTEFFQDLDVVPSDIVAGLVLLRKHQRLHRTYIVHEVRLHSTCTGLHSACTRPAPRPAPRPALGLALGLQWACIGPALGLQ